MFFLVLTCHKSMASFITILVNDWALVKEIKNVLAQGCTIYMRKASPAPQLKEAEKRKGKNQILYYFISTEKTRLQVVHSCVT